MQYPLTLCSAHKKKRLPCLVLQADLEMSPRRMPNEQIAIFGNPKCPPPTVRDHMFELSAPTGYGVCSRPEGILEKRPRL